MQQRNTVQKLAAGSIAVALVVLGLKYLAYAITGSVAFYSDAIESIINVVTALAAFAAVRISARPADAGHPYGHSKVEYFSAVLEGVLIIVASLAILHEAYGAFLRPHPIHAPVRGLVVSSVATAINGIWCYVLLSRGRRERSPSLVADGTHLLTDVYSSGGVVVGVILVAVTGWQPLDPIVAALVAVNIVWSGWSLIRESLDGLMDAAMPPADVARVEAIIDRAMTGAIEAHDLRTRHAGRLTFIDFHLVVAGDSTVDASHEICDRIEAALKNAFPDTTVSIHVEPDWKQKHGPMTLAAEPKAPPVEG
ncbi:MAG: cation diffusion facilitator family transporter [Janthinobacterium lividum]